ncbi:MAG: hypothetical protein Q9N67_06755 [Ghiorsea sp.]|nr:hypothetical protein [Ghiorsea sp.]
MKKVNFPYLAVALCLTFLPIIIIGNSVGADGQRAVPLLSLLVINEFAFFIAAAGIYIGVQHMGNRSLLSLYGLAIMCCAVFLVAFTLLGIELWPL